MATIDLPQGVPKAWVNFNGTGTVAIRDSHNVDSITDNTTGDYTVNITSGALANANYCAIACGLNANASRYAGGYNATPTATAWRMTFLQPGVGTFDEAWLYAAFIGDA